MATKQTIARLMKIMLASYPKERTKLSDDALGDMATAWGELLADIDDDLLGFAVRAHIETSQWMPSIAEIRTQAAKLTREASPMRQSASEAWGDVHTAIRRIGHNHPCPVFENPITAVVVKRMGWYELCIDEGPEGVTRAQFERYYNTEIERLDRDNTLSGAVRNYIEAQRVQQLTAGVVAQLTGPKVRQ